MKKYEMTDETIEIDGHTLHRIKALIDFSDVKAGDLGGFIEKEENLSHYGECWTYDEAKVYEDAEVFGSAIVSGRAAVHGIANVYGCAEITEKSEIFGEAEVHGDCSIGGSSNIYGTANIYGNVLVRNIIAEKGEITDLRYKEEL